MFPLPSTNMPSGLLNWLALEPAPLPPATVTPVLAPGARVVVESDPRAPLELALLAPSGERRYGDTMIRIHEMTTT